MFVGTVVRIMNFGAFVEFAPGKDGMIHLSSPFKIICNLKIKTALKNAVLFMTFFREV